MSLMGCVQRSAHPIDEDPSIVFPSFYEQAPVRVGVEKEIFELDGKALRAIQLAANDFLPPDAKNPPCWATQEAHTYRVLRQGELLFVRIDEDPSSCGREIPALHSGAQYAISLDGRILRRLVDGQPDDTALEERGSSPPGVQAEPGVVPGYEPRPNTPSAPEQPVD